MYCSLLVNEFININLWDLIVKGYIYNYHIFWFKYCIIIIIL